MGLLVGREPWKTRYRGKQGGYFARLQVAVLREGRGGRGLSTGATSVIELPEEAQGRRVRVEAETRTDGFHPSWRVFRGFGDDFRRQKLRDGQEERHATKLASSAAAKPDQSTWLDPADTPSLLYFSATLFHSVSSRIADSSRSSVEPKYDTRGELYSFCAICVRVAPPVRADVTATTFGRMDPILQG